MREKMHRRDKTTPVNVSECLCGLKNNLWDSKGMNKTSCFFRMNTRNDQSKGHSRETGDESEKGGKVKGSVIGGQVGVYSTKVFRSCVDYVCCLGQLFAGEETALRAPNPIPIPISVRVHISVLDSLQSEDTKKSILPGGSIRGVSSFTGRWVCCCRGSFWFRSSGGICAGCARGFLRDLFF